MNQYSDVYLRNNLYDKGEIPLRGSSCYSPDIIPYGLSPVNDPQTFFSNNYNTDVAKDLVPNAGNYCYIRGKNLSQQTANGSFYLYYAKPSLILYPDQWQDNPLKTSTGKDCFSFEGLGAGNIAVSTDPFTWEPGITSGSNYCMVGRVVTPGHPNDIPRTREINKYARCVLENPGICRRNIAFERTDTPTWTQIIEYSQGDAPSEVQFAIICNNVPVGCEIAFSSATPGPSPDIYLPTTKVTNSFNFVMGVKCQIPANYVTNITYSYWANGKTPPKGFTIKICALLIVPLDHDNYSLASTLEALGIPETSDNPGHQNHLNDLHESIGPSKVILVGEHYTIGS